MTLLDVYHVSGILGKRGPGCLARASLDKGGRIGRLYK
jgi:hypothetical protein